jgi:hypothetical protein
LGINIADNVAIRQTNSLLGKYCPEPETESTAATGIVSPAPNATGVPGAPGEKGETGATGQTGQTGLTGETGTAGTDCKCVIIDNLSALAGSLVPTQDNVFTLGTNQYRWNSLHLGPGTLYIEDAVTGEPAAISVNNGALFIDGAESLRLGNIQMTTSGLLSLLPDQDITIGKAGDSGYLSTARGIKFPDGSVQNSSVGSPLRIGTQDGNQTPSETLDLSKQVFVFNDGLWILPDGQEGSQVNFVMGTGGSAEDIYIQVAHLRTITSGQAVVRTNQLWSPFSYTGGSSTTSVITAVFTQGAWNISGGTLR